MEVLEGIFKEIGYFAFYYALPQQPVIHLLVICYGKGSNKITDNYSINLQFHESGAVVVARDIHSPVGARRLQLFVKF